MNLNARLRTLEKRMPLADDGVRVVILPEGFTKVEAAEGEGSSKYRRCLAEAKRREELEAYTGKFVVVQFVEPDPWKERVTQ